MPVDNLPEFARINLDPKEEIMNVVLIVTGQASEYEIIVRDADLNRYVMQISPDGEIINRKGL